MKQAVRGTEQLDIHDDRAATANYIATMSGDLAAMARQHGIDTLAYVLDMAQMEAENAARPGDRD